jgi:hypothetical protein
MIPDFPEYWESMCLDAKRECYVNFGQKISAGVYSVLLYLELPFECSEDHSYFLLRV